MQIGPVQPQALGGSILSGRRSLQIPFPSVGRLKNEH